MSKEHIITIKIGSSTLLTKRHLVDEFRVGQLAVQIKQLQETNWGIILVVSGAVACGSRFLSHESDLEKQAAAGIGQVLLISKLAEIFRPQKLTIAQILVIQRDICNLSSVIDKHLEHGIVPVFNENDVIELNGFGGNDFLAVEVARLTQSSHLLILSTMAGSVFGVGGGEGKLQAVNMAQDLGINTQIVDGKAENILLKTINI